MNKYDVAVIGGGMAGMATAMRMQTAGKSTIVFESHGQPGGCAGFYSKKGFSFDVGATTLVDFGAQGIGGDFLNNIGLSMPDSDLLDYKLWLPDRCVYLYREKAKWQTERALKLGDTPAHRKFWRLVDRLADVFWKASRMGIKLPFQNSADVLNAIKAIGLVNLPLARYMKFTVIDALRKYKLENDIPLKAALSMLVEDTVNSTLEEAPLINAALGITIRGAGLYRVKGGMKGFWGHFTKHYKLSGGILMVGNKVKKVDFDNDNFLIVTTRGTYKADQVISAIPAENTMDIVPNSIKSLLNKYVSRDKHRYESAIVVFLGVPESEIENEYLTHHQLLYDYDLPLGNGNNMFIYISTPGDFNSAPDGYRSVMISTHCQIADWIDLSEEEYLIKKNTIGNHLLNLARKIFPKLGQNAKVFEIGTPRTYQKFTNRINGAVGGVRQNKDNSNFNAIPYNIGVRNFRLVGDTTWPGLGTVASILGSKIVAEQLLNS